MKLKTLSVFIIVLSLILFCVGCTDDSTNTGPTGATVSDETTFSPPEEEGNITGSWTATSNEVTSNRYFYGNGILVTIEQDPEEETWCYLSLWSDSTDSEEVSIEQKDAYKYDEESAEWLKQEVDSEKIISARFNDKDKENESIMIEQTLPNGISVELLYKRGQSDIQIPDEVTISAIINDFLMQ